MSRYSDEQRATALAALDANGGNVAATARHLALPRSTLKEWAAGRTAPAVAELRQQKKADLATVLEDLAYTLVEALPGKIGEATLQQVATTLGITVDKMQLLRGKPNAITQDVTDLTDDERAERIVALLATARARRDAAALAAPTAPGPGPVRAPSVAGAGAGDGLPA